jgi:hypothetical protein
MLSEARGSEITFSVRSLQEKKWRVSLEFNKLVLGG